MLSLPNEKRVSKNPLFKQRQVHKQELLTKICPVLALPTSYVEKLAHSLNLNIHLDNKSMPSSQ
jgi:hypothetical protein